MKTVYNDVGRGVDHYAANVKNENAAQRALSGDLSRKKAIEASVRMGGFEVGFKQNNSNSYDTKQSMTGHSEFWIS